MDGYPDASKKIPSAHLQSVCKYASGETTCKYAIFYQDGFYCVKNISSVKKKIDQIKDMIAKSDNCQGL